MQVLGQNTVACLAKAEDVLDHTEHVLDLGAHPRSVAVLRLFHFIDSAVVPLPLVGEVLGVRRVFVDDIGLTLMALVTPHARLFAVQQMMPLRRR